MTNTIVTATNTAATPTPSAMNNYLRTKPYMATDKDVKDEAKALGYQYVGTWSCDACAEEMTIAAQSVGYTGVTPPWGKANNCALKFKKKGATVAACRCGWRKNITIKFTKIEKPKCTGCGATITSKDGLCYNPIHNTAVPASAPTGYTMPIAQPEEPTTQATVPTKVCSRPGCNNPVPAGRKTICESCRNTPKEPVSSNYIV